LRCPLKKKKNKEHAYNTKKATACNVPEKKYKPSHIMVLHVLKNCPKLTLLKKNCLIITETVKKAVAAAVTAVL